LASEPIVKVSAAAYGVLLNPLPYPNRNGLVLVSVFDLDQSAEAGALMESCAGRTAGV
jgi:hypothetical protein